MIAFYSKIPVFPFLKCGNTSLYREFLVKILVILFTNSLFTRRMGV
ncbi:hypothetical protein LEP1GSC062_1479 [Leptospira alexanderi serovar Manhao 3 str. L 60]|uniref:Uncharacterized protein n=1 Tax=Leptospira alexanderi serovar Manhao 3 str. L 60 TaxID=1049759 RepID=V6HTW6_9LEPT|nr:hypothetical protein LEP1GSC062_1479 [Leptospira alexanderi serovar Manhao 3 str. L 60]